MAWVLASQDLNTLVQVLSRVNPTHLAVSTASYMCAQILLSIRWWLLVRGLGIGLRPMAAVKLYLVGAFYSNLTPSSVGGDLVRAWYVARYSNQRAAAAMSVLVDRLLALMSMLVLVIAVWVGLGPDPRASDLLVRWPSGHLRPAVIAAIAAVVLAAGLCLGALPWLRRRVITATTVAVRTLADCVRAYARRPVIPLAGAVLTIILQSWIILAFWWLGRGMGIEADLRDYFIIFPLTWLVSAVPVSIAGIGLLEGGTVALFAQLAGVAPEKALALALWQRSVWIVTSLPGAAVYLLGLHVPDAKSVD